MGEVLHVRDYRAYFHTRRGIVKAVDGLNFNLSAGETLGIVGESGSGKSVFLLSLLGLLPKPPLRIESGSAQFGGMDLVTASEDTMRSIRGNKIAMIFQEPMTSLNPYLKIGTQLIEPLMIHRNKTKDEAFKIVKGSLLKVGIGDPDRALNAYPHEFSGGMRQRVMIAMALTTHPEILIADEPTTALDVTVQAQILELLKSIQKETGMAVILVTHDLGVVAGVADRCLVMYAGKLFEQGSVDDIFYRSQHPYAHALLKSTPRLDKALAALPSIAGTAPDLSKLGPGCPFDARCEYVKEECRNSFPTAKRTEEHESFCHLEKLP
ncbi:MAG: ABC transporter ATP-binding protein [Deltaproteobacteria bacterium]|nr:ABC transporter ATP-binding protein [Deltaproteobacteria bacterium]